jgi:hypothetical protein
MSIQNPAQINTPQKIMAVYKSSIFQKKNCHTTQKQQQQQQL